MSAATRQGWRTLMLGDVMDFKNGLNKAKEFFGAGTPIVNFVDVLSNTVLAASNVQGRVTVTRKEIQQFSARRGDAFFTRTSESVKEIGTSAVLTELIPDAVFSGFVLRGRRRNQDIDPIFLAHALRGDSVRKQIMSTATYTTRALTNGRALARVTFELPPIHEQQRIGAALADADRSIELLERLIAKKAMIKESMMQQLLTGSTRLPGFSGPWTSLQLASRSLIKARIGWQGLTAGEYRPAGLYRLVGGTEFLDGGIAWHTAPYVDKWRYDQDLGIQLRRGDVLLTKDGTIGKTAYVEQLPGPATLNSGVFVIRPLANDYHSRLLYYMLRSRAFGDFLSRLTAGSTISHLYQRDLVGLVLEMPPTIEEQESIAEVLADADRDLNTLRARLNKAAAIKQGMMHELLTGRTKLPLEEPAAA